MAADQKKTRILVSVDTDDLGDLIDLCKDYRNLNPNQLLAMAAGELAKLKEKKGELFHALARISAVDTSASDATKRKRTSSAPARAPEHALSVAH